MEVLLGFLAGFAFGKLGWWIVVGIGLWIILAWIDDAEDAVVTTVVVFLIGITALPYGSAVGDAIARWWLLSIVLTVGYLMAGMFWALLKFDRYVAKLKKQYPNSGYQLAIPLANKGRIINWILHWPFSAIHDITIDLGNTLYAAISGRLEAIVVKHFGRETK